jgi:uncharacterized membrane-anchored protein
MKKRLFIIIFIIFCILQLTLPGYMAVKTYMNLASGRIVKLECALIDPYDIIKGRYINLHYAISDVSADICPDRSKFTYNSKVFCILEEINGFHRIKSVIMNKPDKNELFIKARIESYYDKNPKVFLGFDFDRYYMQEDLSPLAEQIFTRDNFRKLKPYVLLSVNDSGEAVIKKLLINNQGRETEIEKFIRQDFIK